jgi:hypothetical protein
LFCELLRFWSKAGCDASEAAGVDPTKPRTFARAGDSADNDAVLGNHDDLENRFHWTVFKGVLDQHAPGLVKLHHDAQIRTWK